VPVLAGEKIIALGITEPSGGSDVANLRTKAQRVGDHYVVNGSKMFITSGMRADWLTCAVRTGGPGAGGVSLLLIDMEHARRLTHAARQDGLALFGYGGDPFRGCESACRKPDRAGEWRLHRHHAQFQFSERLGMAMGCCAYARVCLKEAVEWAQQRETFGKPLVKHQSIRIKLADMARQIDATQAWVDLCAWQVQEGRDQPADFAMLKVQGNTDARSRRPRCSAGAGRGQLHHRLQGGAHLP
jgi:acyl-CoA dehydrogenase